MVASTGRVSVVALGVVVVVAAIVGDTVGYEVGKRYGPRLLRTRLFSRYEHRVDAARGFLDGRGASAIFVGRFTAFLRAVTPGLAGLSGMRYRRFLAVSRGAVRIVAGTRAAVFAPVADLGLIAIFDDGDDLLAEPRAPYPHAREVLMLRSAARSCALLVGGFARTAEAQLLVDSGWARAIASRRSALSGPKALKARPA